MSAEDPSPEPSRVPDSGGKATAVTAVSLTSLVENLKATSAFTDGYGTAGGSAALSSVVESLKATSGLKDVYGTAGVGSVSRMLASIGAAASLKDVYGTAGGSAALSSVVASLKATSGLKDVYGTAGVGSVSRMLASIGAAASLKDVYGTAGVGSISKLLENTDQSLFEDIVRSLRDTSTDAPLLVADQLFTQMEGEEAALLEVSQTVDLTIPFGHDRVIRGALQLVIVTVVAAALFGISLLTHPVFAAAAALLTATGTPKPKEVWKATGEAYDRIYGASNYHPERAIDSSSGHGPKGKW
jgi:hypothetical protein